MWNETLHFSHLYCAVRQNKTVFEGEILILILTKLLGVPEAIRDVFVKCCHWRALKHTDEGREQAGGGRGSGGGGGGEEIPCFIHPPLLQ